MIVRKLRLQRGWSQEHLAQVTGISVRTIQRIERGAKPGLESAKSLASVFEVDISVFTPGETAMNDVTNESIRLKNDEREAIDYVKGIKGFYEHVAIYSVFVALELFGVGRDVPLHSLYVWGLVGWGIGVAIHFAVAYELLNGLVNPKWEKKWVEKRLGRKL